MHPFDLKTSTRHAEACNSVTVNMNYIAVDVFCAPVEVTVVWCLCVSLGYYQQPLMPPLYEVCSKYCDIEIDQEKNYKVNVVCKAIMSSTNNILKGKSLLVLNLHNEEQ